MNPPESVDLSAARICDLVAVFEIISVGVFDQSLAERDRRLRLVRVVTTPERIDSVKLLRCDCAVGFQPDVSIGIQKFDDVVCLFSGFITVFFCP